MAEGVGGTAKVTCRFFLNGSCNDGENCYFAHDSARGGTPDKVCRYFLKGYCMFGSRCRNDHVALKSLGGSHKSSASPHSSGKLAAKKNNCPETNPSPLRHPPSAFKGKVPTMLSSTGQSSMVVLSKKDNSQSDNNNHHPSWVNAPEFVPQEINRSYAEVVHHPELSSLDTPPLCPYASEGFSCLANCPFLHGDACDLCEKLCLHPSDLEQRRQHREECLREIEKHMEHSFAIQRSMGKTCGICMEVIMDKEPPSERRFGILEKCSHVFCLTCIRQWRQTKQFDSKNTRGCPECRTLSDFVTPSKYWVDDQDEKTKIIKEYKDAMSKKPCKYFKQGQGLCPFGGACFYSHTLSDGTKVDLPPPLPRRNNRSSSLRGGIERVFLWEFFDVLDDSWSHLDDVDWSSWDSDDNASEVSFEFIFS